LVFEGKRLFEHCPVGIVPNVSCVLALDGEFSEAPRVALIGDPDCTRLPKVSTLKLAAEEVRIIAETYTSERIIGDALLSTDATEEGFWQLTSREESAGGILHVACHGEFETGDPLNSSLLMADARIDAAEIARSRLAFHEAILSACSTGRRPTQVHGLELTGDDILGLPGAFLEAGVRSVLVSIPEARDDAALEFMTIYHERRAKGDPPLRALRATQTTMLGQGELPPCLWVGFTVYGCQ
jgi:CHAT domain-containing protein